MDVKHLNTRTDPFGGQHKKVSRYYGDVLQSSEDLKTSACCALDAMPGYVRKIMPLIDEKILSRFYGCGSPIPPVLEGCRVLDLGCGTGRDVYLASSLVGPSGRVIGVDMTEEQLAVAREHMDGQMERFGFSEPNVEFVSGHIEDLQAAGIKDGDMDVVMSNCVLNLASDKRKVFEEIHRILKPGGELYFSDVFADRRIPEAYLQDEVLLGECLSGALYIEDFRRMIRDIFDSEFYTLTGHQIELHDAEIVEKVGDIGFYSLTVRVFKVAGEDREENYGHRAVYQGGPEDMESAFEFDRTLTFTLTEEQPISSNVANIIRRSRYSDYFEISGGSEKHLGPVGCGFCWPSDRGGSCC